MIGKSCLLLRIDIKLKIPHRRLLSASDEDPVHGNSEISSAIAAKLIGERCGFVMRQAMVSPALGSRDESLRVKALNASSPPPAILARLVPRVIDPGQIGSIRPER
ncbi:hypothetical protein FDV58_28675 [Bradyrhizobium elkanii]|uniref:Uncharacterized protein n=1 Tax=Bradyrhizobium elkanii TaxID=29448 RepID=A0A4U6RZP3_BRAEL|nr:hypothetical protein [Bradyrhizobium elkanii]TKV77856.1 hypothetical protein FDV58_28675 [Bradyrhizobium elkanii]